jgi:hypothetical protein
MNHMFGKRRGFDKIGKCLTCDGCTYHPDLGYPQQIISRYHTNVDWTGAETWWYIWHYRQPPAQCGTFQNGGERRIAVQSFTPLP